MALIHGELWGSGYAVAANMVLTSGHVVGGHSTTCTVLPAIGGEYRGSVLWRGDHLGADAALVRVKGAPWGSEEPFRWAEIRGTGRAPVLTLGYGWVGKEGTTRHLHEESWLVSPTNGRETRTYRLDLDNNSPRDRISESSGKRLSAWSGLSGGAVLTRDGNGLIGVVRGDKDKFTNSALGAVRVKQLLEDDDFAYHVGSGTDVLLEVWTLPDPGGTPDSGSPEQYIPKVLRANRISPEWRFDSAPCPFDDAYSADLGAWIVLGRGPSTAVVAAPPGTDLATAFSGVEQGPVADGGADVRERRWHSMDPSIALPEREAELLRLRDSRSAGTGGAGLGLVVTWPRGETDQRARECRNRIRSVAPNAAVVFMVSAPLLVDAVAAGCAVARETRSGQGAEPTEVFALPWFDDVDPDIGSGTADPVAAGPAVARLMAGVRSALRSQGLPTPGPGTADPAPLPRDADPDDIADAIISELNAGSGWRDAPQESVALRLVRDYQPRLFAALISRHAARRTPPHHWASLRAAMPVDRHVDIWLSAVSVLGEPRDIPPVLRETPMIDALILGMLRAGTAASLTAPWIEYARQRRTPVGKLAHHLGSSPASELAAFLASETAAVGSAATRAGLLVPVPDGMGSDAWWAIMGRVPVTAATVDWLTNSGPNARRAVGFIDDHAEPDIDRVDRILQLRATMRPPLPPWEATS
ncbi:trypsin-like peptidase domain-containing protein [Nocardia sp. NPDC050710]|uniref:trypsin-like peptidase domain-containing protein n=1 Tax=Nocardia sp. NPDC050710 TaxID=3157220 RepID=UPI0033D8714C